MVDFVVVSSFPSLSRVTQIVGTLQPNSGSAPGQTVVDKEKYFLNFYQKTSDTQILKVLCLATEIRRRSTFVAIMSPPKITPSYYLRVFVEVISK